MTPLPEYARRRRRHLPLAAVALALAAALAGPAAAESIRPGPVVMEVPSAPVAVPGSDGRTHLTYELRIDNISSLQLNAASLRIQDARTGRTLRRVQGRELAADIQLGARGETGRTLGAYQNATAFLTVAVPPSRVPKELTHRIAFVAPKLPKVARDITAEGGDTAVIRRRLPVLAAPLRGDRYIAADGCCESTRHVRAQLPLNGSLWLAQRYAIDWERVDAQGRIYVGDRSDPRSYVIYGDPAYAVADGVVVDAVDGFKEYPPGQLPDDLPISEADGNHVIQRIAKDTYVLYAHFQPGSVRVRKGQRIRTGQELGLVGTSGNSSAPHLHLHVMDGPSGLVSDGIPYVFDRFRLTGIDRQGTSDFDRAEEVGTPLTITPFTPPTTHTRQLPLDLTIVDWGP